MSYLDDFKKLYKNVSNVGNAVYNGVKDLYSTAQNAGQNIANAATGQTPTEVEQPKQEAQPADSNWVNDYNQFNSQEAPQPASAPAPETPTDLGQNVNATNAQDVTWKSQVDDIMKQIMSHEKFNYDMNGDALYQQYADIYKNQANMAMQNAMAQSAALTGGYGSSYAQSAGQQAYAQQMQGLNEIGLDLYDRAYNRHRNELSDLYNQYSMLSEQEQLQYNREYQEAKDKAEADQWTAMYGQYTYDENGNITGTTGGYLADQSLEEFERLYGKGEYDESGNYIPGTGGYYTEQDYQNKIANDAADKTAQDQFNFLYGAKYDENGNLVATGDGYYDNQNKVESNVGTYTGASDFIPEGTEVPIQLAGVDGLTTTDTKFFDENGTLKQAALVSVNYAKEDGAPENPDKSDVVTYRYDGKEIKLRRGYSPYTNTKNPDADKGTFNGYQPDNVGGAKLKITTGTYVVNGEELPIYTTDGGGEFVYDAVHNEYIELVPEKEEPKEQTTATGGTGASGTAGGKLIKPQFSQQAMLY